ncbi:MAG: ATP-dependent Clp protease ATP-binding subunit [Clostridia bacterium]|nr:ATP-dependent Clp protease ATP-binding subunit [Clostridia bacterium]
MNKFTEKAEKALSFARIKAEELGHTYMGSEHLLLALLSDEYSLSAMILTRSGVKPSKIEELIREFCGVGTRTKLGASDMTPMAKRILEGAYSVSKKYGSTSVGTEHILAALLDEKDSVAVKMLNYIDADNVGIKDEVHTLLRASDSKSKKSEKDERQKTPFLSKYGKNLTESSVKFDPLIGRDKEIDRLIRVLTRKNKNNPCLIGEAGVGKTAIVEGLAARIASGDVPLPLFGKEIFSVDLTSMVAGAKYRGDFEERINAIAEEAAKNENIILFIDEIHTIVGAGAAEGAIDAANILKPKLARREIRLIGATTLEEYKKYIEKDSALERRFQPIVIKEPGVKETEMILRGIKARYEEHHGILIDDSAIVAASELSDRYIHDRHMPDKAIDLLDEACAKCAMECNLNSQKIKNIDKKIKQIKKDKEEAVQRLDFDAASGFRDLELIYKSELRGAVEAEESVIKTLRLKRADVVAVTEEIIGVKLEGESFSDIGSLRCVLSENIIGQDDAVRALSESVVRNSIGIKRDEKPLGVFLFVGASGVGKTALASELARALFGDAKYLIRYDMSEFSESSSVSKFVGSAPGYVGYDDGRSVLERVRRNPYSVVLLDEFEKACREVKNLFLQIADRGTVTDSHGREISFKNTYIILTANTESSVKCSNIGFTSTTDIRRENIAKDLLGDELLGRMDRVIFFPRPSGESLVKIAKRALSDLTSALGEFGIGLQMSEAAVEFIASNGAAHGGVRNIYSYIKHEIEGKLAEKIAGGEIAEKDTVRCEYSSENGISLSVKKTVNI